MKEKLQKFGGAMFTPILFFSGLALFVAITTIFRNPLIMGSIAEPGTHWSNVWTILQDGAWTIINQLEVLFAVSLPLGLAKKAQGRAAVESLIVYLSYQTVVSKILTFYGGAFNIDLTSESQGGLKTIAGIQTLDTGIIGALLIASLVVFLHNKYYDKKLPSYLGTFQGSTYVIVISYLAIIPVAIATCFVWPKIQVGIDSLQVLIQTSGAFGIGLYAFLERFLLPTGLHHFVWLPFMFGPAAVEGGVSPYYILHMQEFAESTRPLIEIFPEGGYGLLGGVKLFAPLAIVLAFSRTAKNGRQKQVMTMLLPLAITAIISGITEPLEFAFLFLAPQLFLVYALITGLMAFTMYSFGVVSMGSGLIDTMTKFWVPMFSNHWQTVLTQLALGLVFACIYYFAFKFMIEKFDLQTPGRESEETLAAEGIKATDAATTATPTKTNQEPSTGYRAQAEAYLDAFGGKENIDSVNNCATRLRIVVHDETKVQPDAAFKNNGAHGVVRNGKSFQVIVGLDVGNVRAEFDELVK